MHTSSETGSHFVLIPLFLSRRVRRSEIPTRRSDLEHYSDDEHRSSTGHPFTINIKYSCGDYAIRMVGRISGKTGGSRMGFLPRAARESI